MQGTGLDLRPLRSSVSTQGVYFTGAPSPPRSRPQRPATPSTPRTTGPSPYPYRSTDRFLSFVTSTPRPCHTPLQDLATERPPRPQRRPSRGLLDVTSVTINNSEIDKDSALFILSAARQALDAVGDINATGALGKVAGSLKDRVEREQGGGGGSASWGGGEPWDAVSHPRQTTTSTLTWNRSMPLYYMYSMIALFVSLVCIDHLYR